MATTPLYKGGKFYVCTTPQPNDLSQTEFEGLTWVECTAVSTQPLMGVTDNIVTDDTLDTDVSQKQKGFSNAGDGELVLSYRPGDVGQIAMVAAAKTSFQYAIKQELSDAPNASTTNTVNYTRSVIGGGGFPGGGGEDFVRRAFQLGMNQRPVEVAPEAI